MSVSETFVVPGARAVLRQALPNIIEGKIVPLVLFLSCYRLWGTGAALVAALSWSLGVFAYRRARGRRIPGLLLLGLVGLAGKTIVALATGSMLLYFLQPTVTTALVGCVFLGSTFVGRPLAERLVLDLWPIEPHWVAHIELRRFFSRLSVLWAVTSLVNAGVTLWLLTTQPVTTFVLVKSLLGPLCAVGAVVPAVLWLRASLRGHGIQVEFATRAVAKRPLDVVVTAPVAA